MNAGAFLSAARALPLVSLQAITGGCALILAPHPDDESLGCGGLIAEACAQGEPPVVVVLTDGAKSHPKSRTYPFARLRALRQEETLAAAACLGLPAERVYFLRRPDTEAPSDGPGVTLLARKVAGFIEAHGCKTILASWEHDPHGDHVAAHCIAAAAAAMAGVVHRAYPVWGLTLSPDAAVTGPATGMRLDISRHLAAKRQAIRAHASQHAGIITDDPAGFQMSPEFMALFDDPAEIYLDVCVSRRTGSIEPAYFDQMYAADPDPWRFATSEYEAEKYAATLAALPPRRFAAALEVGCSIGVLTAQFARRCDRLLALDVAATALDVARARCPDVRFERRQVPQAWPPGRFDLIVLSEMLYYLDAPGIAQTAIRAVNALQPGGVILLVHYLGETDYPTSGDDAAARFIAAAGLTPGFAARTPGYRIDRLDRAPPG